MVVKGGHTLFGNYVPPSDSIYFDDTCLADLCNAFLPKNSDYAVIGGGDFNARFGNLYYAPIPGSKYRINCDEIINSHGRILKIYFQESQIDICLSNLKGIDYIKSFTVEEIGWNPSDHQPVILNVQPPIN